MVIEAKTMGVHDLYGYNLVVTKGEKVIICSSSTIGGDDKKAVAREIVRTFAVK